MLDKAFKRNRLSAALAAILGVGAIPLALAADEAATAADGVVAAQSSAEEETIEVIEVRGIRGSLYRSMDLKRGANGVVDAISAEELGKFPDTNLAESLQRITGVTVSRANGEGSQITVRGFGPEYNLITLNGRQMPGTGYTRSYNLENLSSEGVKTLEVVKTARADTPTGGLGATVNIITHKPLDNPGQSFSFSGKGIYDESNEEGDDVTPELAGIYSNTFMDDRFGFLASVSHQERDFRQQTANSQGWIAQTDNSRLPVLAGGKAIDGRETDAEGNPVARFRDAEGNAVAPFFFPRDMNFSINDVERERTNGMVTLQFAATDNLILTADYVATRAITASDGFGWGIWNSSTEGAPVIGYELDANGTALYSDIRGGDGSFTANRSTTEVNAESVGLNIDWSPNEAWRFTLDYHNSSNEIDNGADKGLGSAGQVILGSDKLVSKVYDYRSGEVPHFLINWNNGTHVLDAGDIDSNFSQFIHSPGKSEIDQVQLNSNWYPEFNEYLVKVDFGAAYTKQTMSGTTAWSGLRGGPGFNPSYTEIFPDAMFELRDASDLLDELGGGGSALMPDYYYTFSFDEAVARQLAFITPEIAGDNYYSIDPYFDGIDSSSLVEEKTLALYLTTQWGFDIGNVPVNVNLGLRYEKTDTSSTVKQRVESQVVWASPTEWIMQYVPGGDDNYFTQDGDYDVWLPMLDISAEPLEDVVVRFSAGKTIARPLLGDMVAGRTLSGSPKIGARRGGLGNPGLLPLESINLDLSLEYYYNDASYAAIGLFYKDVDNFVSRSTAQVTIDGLHDVYNSPRYLEAISQLEAAGTPVSENSIFEQMIANGYGNADGQIEPLASDPLIVWDVTSPVNSDSKSVHGVELALQHVFGESGFGFGVNGTFVDGDVEFDPYSLAQQQPLEGLGNSANFQAFYEKDGLTVKLTYAWRDSYLIGVGQSQGSADAPPQYAKDFGQLDASINYDVNDYLTVFFEGINLNNETEQGYGRFEEQFLFARQYGSRYALGARVRF
ncbi:TonB-dependent receptor [Shewanella litorisediminis]|uniref:TonB-dependent receptor n=1 Tax=Shewanella litorisediminis TaxID=1173586 RepID=A0ABX7G6X8_9GAMM|nr:TonB-dependent receptor [Shewanella litorisediminis]MCL2916710.1 TonB-dependent receptor [Shewanella litorisediminis]QRH03119.1 TonB-dependent receptor [Shewanella litorisediminis]